MESLGFAPQEGVSYLVLQSWSKPAAGEVIDSGLEPGIAMLLSGPAVDLLSNYVCLYTLSWDALSFGHRNFFFFLCSG